jgi:predicted NBD/HSP70 family sugar kinase
MSNHIGGNAKVVRNINRATILNIIREKQPISRVAIAKLIGLNKSTVSSIVNDLLNENLLNEHEIKDQNIGRNPIQLSLKTDVNFVGAVNIDYLSTHIGIFDINGTLIRSRVIDTDMNAMKKFLIQCADSLSQLKKEIKVKRLKGVGVTVTGIIDTENSKLSSAHFGVKDIDIGKMFRDIMSAEESIIFENNANSCALAEKWFGKNDSTDFVYMWIGDGIGAGIIVNGQLMRGEHFSAGELGRINMFQLNDSQSYKEYDNLERFASNEAILNKYFQFSGAEKEPYSENRLREIITKALQGDDIAVNVLLRTSHYLGLGLAGIIQVLDPQLIILGGIITDAWDIIHPELERQIYQWIDHKIELKRTTFDVKPGLIGAAALPIMDIFTDYTITK